MYCLAGPGQVHDIILQILTKSGATEAREEGGVSKKYQKLQSGEEIIQTL